MTSLAMRPAIEKRIHRVPPQMPDYAAACAAFSWEEARKRLAGLPGGGLNMAYEAVGRHAGTDVAQRVALRHRGRAGELREITFCTLAADAERFAGLLSSFGLGRGDVVFTLLDRVPELYTAVLGTLQAGVTLSPLFSAFGPEPLRTRVALAHGALLVTTPSLYRRKVAPVRAQLPHLKHVLLVGDPADLPGDPGCLDFRGAMADRGGQVCRPSTTVDDIALLHFTSGTTGTPKGALHAHGAVLWHRISAALALDLRPGDVYWCTADPGWVTGMSYGIIAPLALGVTSVVDEGDFDAERWYRVLQDERVSVWYTAPTAIRMLMRAGPDLPRRFDLSALRHICSVGEPLNPEGVVWGSEVLGQPIHDNWWQTETGGIMIANYPSLAIRPGSMGKPLPGVEAAIVHRTAGHVDVITNPDEEGELALRAGWPSMFRGYLNDQARYAGCFSDGWYLTGDLARCDADGYYWFVGRMDDVIKSAGHLIGPFEVESALVEHPAVVEAAVIGIPDPVIGETVKAFVALRPGYQASEALLLELRGFARQRLGPAVAPREIAVLDVIPRTRSGKIMRRLLRARELGLPEGDLSTMEGAP